MLRGSKACAVVSGIGLIGREEEWREIVMRGIRYRDLLK